MGFPLRMTRRTWPQWLPPTLLALALWPHVGVSQCATMIQPESTQLGMTTRLVGDDNDRMKVAGSFVLPTSTFAALNPLANGMTVEVDDGNSATVISQSLPAGAYDRATKIGWSLNGDSTQWLFRNNNRFAPETNGIRRVILLDQGDTQPNQVRVQVIGAHGAYPVEAPMVLPFNAKVTVDNATGDCGETGFFDTECKGHSSTAVNSVHCFK
jgi:hypothetical protein